MARQRAAAGRHRSSILGSTGSAGSEGSEGFCSAGSERSVQSGPSGHFMSGSPPPQQDVRDSVPQRFGTCASKPRERRAPLQECHRNPETLRAPADCMDSHASHLQSLRRPLDRCVRERRRGEHIRTEPTDGAEQAVPSAADLPPVVVFRRVSGEVVDATPFAHLAIVCHTSEQWRRSLDALGRSVALPEDVALGRFVLALPSQLQLLKPALSFWSAIDVPPGFVPRSFADTRTGQLICLVVARSTFHEAGHFGDRIRCRGRHHHKHQ